MCVWIPLLILAAAADAPNTAPASDGKHNRYSEAVELYSCDFEPADDANADGWPDHWTRRSGVGFPPYVEIGIQAASAKNPAPSGKHFLRMELNGGGATAYSPPIPASSKFSYVLEAQLKTADLARSVAFCSVQFYDENNKFVEEHRSEATHDATDWRKVLVGPVVADHKNVRTAVIGLHLEPEGAYGDLHGVGMFDDVWFARLPRMTLTTNSEHNVYTKIDGIEITCQISGILERDPMLTFELIDVSSKRLAEISQRLEGQVVAQETTRAAVVKRQNTETRNDGTGFQGVASWKPPIKEYGFYRVRVTMQGTSGVMHERNITLAVLRPEKRPTGGEYGWSLPRGEEPLSMKSLISLLPQVGINWVKFPAWYGDKDSQQIDRLAWFAEKLSIQGIEMIGVLDQPPPEMRKLFGSGQRLPVASLFVEPELWHPAVDPVMTRLSLKVRWWQLGRDDDLSYVGYPDMEAKIRETKQHLDHFGQVINLGLSWRWLQQAPSSENPPWAFLSYVEDPPLSAQELTTYLASEKPAAKNGGPRKWVVLQPLERGQYKVEDRARDLVERMLAAKMLHADCVFVPDPFNTEHGLMNDDGTPGELLLPWRTTAVTLSGAQYVGEVTLPEGSHNYVFTRKDEAIMVVWNERQTTESIYLGENVKQIDLWGRVITPETDKNEQLIKVGPLPTFITGVNLPIARWRMAFHFRERRLSPNYSQRNAVGITLKNTFDQGIGGEVRLNPPSGWRLDPPTIRFRAAPGQELNDDFRAELKTEAASGLHKLRLDFEVTADRHYKFAVYDNLEIGLGDVHMEFTTRLAENGNLIVEQTTFNETSTPVSFICFLNAADRRRTRQLVVNLERGHTVNTYSLPNGQELLGKPLRVQAEEIGGERLLNYRFPAEY